MKKAIVLSLFIIVINNFANAQTCTVITSPNLGPDKTVFVSCFQDVTNLTTLFNTSGLTTQWDIPNPAIAKIGYHWLVVTNGSGCKDTVYINVKQDVKKWLGTTDSNWHNPANWSGNTVPTDKSHILIFGGTPNACIISNSDAVAASIRVLKNGSYKVKSNRKINITTSCDTLPPYYEVGPKTILIDNPTSQTIQLVDSAKVVFIGNTAQLQSLDTSNIIVSGVATNAPYGFLRKVKNVQHIGNIYTITTGDISLETTFKDFFFQYSRPYSKSDTLQQQRLDSAGNTNANSFPIDLNYQFSANVSAYGSITLKPKLTVLIDISNFHLNYAKLEGIFEREAALGLNINAAASLSASTILYKKQLQGFFIPSTPFYILPTLKVKLGADVFTEVAYNASITNSSSVNAYLEYIDSNWHNGYGRTTSTEYNFSGVNGNVNAKLYVEPSIDFKLYNQDSAKGTISAQVYITGEAHTQPKPACKLTAGIAAGVAANLRMFGINFLNVSFPEVFKYEQVLFECFKPKVKTLEISIYPCSRLITAKGNVTDSGSSRIIARGICWSRGHNPTPNDFKKEESIALADSTGGLGIFNDTLTNLMKDTIYYIRSYAVNMTDTAYGEERYFKESFATVTIGTQVWMLRNLDVSTYRNGDTIPQVTDPVQWSGLTTGAWCYYNNDLSNCADYGKLYNWFAVNDPRGLAPLGWHVASQTDWNSLIVNLGGQIPEVEVPSHNNIGAKIKETDTTHWNSPNIGATNSSGFTALPGGRRLTYPNPASPAEFSFIRNNGFWWTSSTNNSPGTTTAVYFWLGGADINVDEFYRKFGYSVRCIKN